MKKILLLIAVFAVVGIILLSYLVLSEDTNEDDWVDPVDPINPDGKIIGTLKQSMIATYDDGTTEDILSDTNSILGVFYNGKRITNLTYGLYGKTNQPLTVNADGYYADFFVYDENNNLLGQTQKASPSSGYKVLNNASWVELITWSFNPRDFIHIDYENGDYQILVTPSGNIQYQKDGIWKNTNLPSEKTFNLKYQRELNLVIKGDSEKT